MDKESMKVLVSLFRDDLPAIANIMGGIKTPSGLSRVGIDVLANECAYRRCKAIDAGG